jgi:hypothetical protein
MAAGGTRDALAEAAEHPPAGGRQAVMAGCVEIRDRLL